MDYVFGYGSLVRDRAPEDPLPEDPLGLAPKVCRLRDRRRTWNVAMDNSLSVPGYKFYRAPGADERPACFVTFLNLRPLRGGIVNGLAFPVDAGRLQTLDRRERNYRRHDVTDELDGAIDGRVWTYLGTPDAEARFAAGLRSDRAVVSRSYLEQVRGGFSAMGAAALAQFDASTDAPLCPVAELERVDLP